MALSSANSTELTAEQVQKVLVAPLAQKSIFLSAGVQIVDTAGPLRIPKGANPTTPDWYGQNEQITDEDPTFDEVTLLPTTMKSVKVLTRFSNELARQSVIALDAALRNRLVTDVANTVDAQLLSASTGAAGTLPKGLFAYAGQTLPVGGALTFDDMIDADALALGANVNLESLVWVMHPTEFTNLRKIDEGASDRKLFQPDATKGGALTFSGHRVIVSSRVPAGTVGLVDFSQIVVARDVAPSVKILDQTFGDFDQQAIRVVARYDAAPVNDDAVIALTGVAWA